MRFDPQKTALLLIEFQNEFASEGGALHKAVAEVMRAAQTLSHTRVVVEAMRAKGGTVMHAPIMFKPGYKEITARPYGILKGVVEGSAFVKGTWGADFAPGFEPASDDIVVEGKRGLDTFASTNLDFILRSKGITTLALTGYLTNCCVESTMRSAYERGFDVITLTDCMAATSVGEHENAIKYDFPMFSRPLKSADFVAQLDAAG